LRTRFQNHENEALKRLQKEKRERYREKKKKWLGRSYKSWIEKIEEYRNKNLDMIIIKDLSEIQSYIEARS